MTRSPRVVARLAALLATVALVFAACGRHGVVGQHRASAPPPRRRPSVAPSASAAAYEAWPTRRRVRRRAASPRTPGELKKITAVDALTVEFQLCTPDAASCRRSRSASFGIQDSD